MKSHDERANEFMAGACFGALSMLACALVGLVVAHAIVGPVLVAESEERAAEDYVRGLVCWGRP